MVEASSLQVAVEQTCSNPLPCVRHERRDPDDLPAFVAGVLRRKSRWRRGMPRHAAEDLLQNALLRLLEHGQDIAPAARGAWLRTALLHEKLHLLRAEALRTKREPELAAHLGERGSPFAAPDAERIGREALAGVSWLLSQVHPERREVAGWCLWKVLRDGEEGLDDIAEGLGIERGTLGSQWARAKLDMAAALRRERAKRRGTSRLAALFAFLSALWVWLVARSAGAHGPTPLVAPAGRAVNAPSPPRRVCQSPGARGVAARWRRRAGAALACGLLSLAVLSHVSLTEHPRQTARLAAPVASVAASLANVAPNAVAAPNTVAAPNAVAAVAATTATTPERAPPPAPRGHPPSTPRHETIPRPEAIPRQQAIPHQQATPPSRTPEPVSDPRLEAARAHLASAHSALHGQGDRDQARRILDLYEMTFPYDPFPSKHAELSAALKAP